MELTDNSATRSYAPRGNAFFTTLRVNTADKPEKQHDDAERHINYVPTQSVGTREK